MKKIISASLLLVLCFSMVACSNNGTTSASTEKTFLTAEEVKMLYSDPDKFKGKYVELNGKVFNDVEQDEKGVYFQMWSNPTKSEGNIIVAFKDKTVDIKSDNYVKVIGKISGTYKGAAEETRVYIKIVNNGKSKFNLYSFNTKIVQDGKQFEEQSNYNADYPKLQTDLLVGTTTDGIIAFPKLTTSDFKLILDASSNDWKESIEDYVFDIKVN